MKARKRHAHQSATVTGTAQSRPAAPTKPDAVPEVPEEQDFATEERILMLPAALVLMLVILALLTTFW